MNPIVIVVEGGGITHISSTTQPLVIIEYDDDLEEDFELVPQSEGREPEKAWVSVHLANQRETTDPRIMAYARSKVAELEEQMRVLTDRKETDMTRKDFELIAEVLRVRRIAIEDRGQDPDTTAGVQFELDMLSNDFADALATTNPSFDRDWFLRAAGVQ